MGVTPIPILYAFNQFQNLLSYTGRAERKREIGIYLLLLTHLFQSRRMIAPCACSIPARRHARMHGVTLRAYIAREKKYLPFRDKKGEEKGEENKFKASSA